MAATDPDTPKMTVLKGDSLKDCSLSLITCFALAASIYNIKLILMAAAAILDSTYKYLESHQLEFDKLVTEALSSSSSLVKQASLQQAY